MEKKLSLSKETKQNKTTITKNTKRKETKKRERKRGSSVRNRTRDVLLAGPRYVHRCHCAKINTTSGPNLRYEGRLQSNHIP